MDIDPDLRFDAPAPDSPLDDDPITASYNVFLNPSLPQGRRLIVLQQPNRTDNTPRPPPTELRLKSHSGMVEVDLPLDNTVAYDRDKGLRWGRILQSSMAAKNGGSHGLAGGFGFGAVQQRSKKKGEGDDMDEYMDWNEAVRQDKVLKTQTLGGQYPDTDEVQCMVGVFQGKNLHLTPVSSLVHLRPQLHHLDATTQQERNASSSSSSAAAASTSKDNPSGGTGAAPAARAIHMTIKNTADGDTVTTETMADRLRYVQTETWRKMRYTDENEEAAWEVYNESLFLQPKAGASSSSSAAAAMAMDVDDDDKKGKDIKGDGAAEMDLEGLVPRFGATWGARKMLEAVSGIVKPEGEREPEEMDVKAEPRSGVHERGSSGRGRGRGAKGRNATIDID
ncbi:hypothetical protein E4U39_007805 [Claviceps sp. Clav50 group G5]|nr:hypothetical protein E4U39_007805 [Claviceps sp. Clav50 group G5]